MVDIKAAKTFAAQCYGKVPEWDERYINMLPNDVTQLLNEGSWQIPDTERPDMPPLVGSWSAVCAQNVGRA